ncbi:acyl transferase domain-containing protein [Alteromonas sp. 76-1]|uniref:type I polyketide synthase n=1 Tax=Alteromonas sp. 76-1 TaxID=2358187 RepID=UPI000FD16504|nr:type I polyketide synthase [Alteromonas sp. 76-1]VEL98332.1 acyl transferase domain-containing protein [Alteromonas sp. 76-1]
MDVAEIIKKAKMAGVSLYLKDGGLAFKARKAGFTDELRSLVKSYKTDIKQYLLAKETARSSSTIKKHDLLKAPLSFAQKRLWIIDKFEGNSSHYNLPFMAKLIGNCQIDYLEESFKQLVLRHQVLRTNFVEEGGQVFQIVKEQFQTPFEVFDFSSMSKEEQQFAIEELAKREFGRAFDLTKDLLIRAQLIKLTDTEFQLLVNLHHIASDGWSIGILIRDIAQNYSDLLVDSGFSLEPLPIQYSDYSIWQQEWFKGDGIKKQLAFWVDNLMNIPTTHNLPLDKVRAPKLSYKGKTFIHLVDREKLNQLKVFGYRNGATLYMVLQAAFASFISRYSQCHDVVIGTPVANRENAELTDLIGFFINMLVLRFDVQSDMTFSELVRQAKSQILSAFSNQQVSFEQLVDSLQPERSLSHSPLFQVALVLQNNQTGELSLPELKIEAMDFESNTAKYDITLFVKERNDGLCFGWEYATDLFEASTIESMANNFVHWLDNLITSPDSKLCELNVINPKEMLKHQQRNRTENSHTTNLCLQDQLALNVEEFGDKFAIIAANKKMTYRELEEQSNQLARYLIEQGLKPGDAVGIVMPSSIDLVVTIFAVLKSGAYYVPFEIQNGNVVNSFHADKNIELIITQTDLAADITAPKKKVICFDESSVKAEVNSKESNRVDISHMLCKPNSIACQILPEQRVVPIRHVSIRHDSLENLFSSLKCQQILSSEEVLLSHVSINSSSHFVDIYLTLLSGATLVLASEICMEDPKCLVEQIEQYNVTTLHGNHSFWSSILNELDAQKLLPIHAIYSDNDWQPALINRIFKNVSRCSHLYGFLETTLCSIATKISDCNTLCMSGEPISNTQLFIVDQNSNEVPDGVWGELTISGVGVNIDHIENKDLLSLESVFKTGQRVRRKANGSIEFGASFERLIHSRGYIISPLTIESELLKVTDIDRCAVKSQLFDIGKGDNEYIVAYVEPSLFPEDDNPDKVEAAKLMLTSSYLETLALVLPDYMMPKAVVIIESLPKLANGKVNYSALPVPNDREVKKKCHVAPKRKLERDISEIWSEVLSIESPGINDNFFEVGGTSIHCIMVQQEINSRTDYDVTITDLFAYPTILDLCNHLLASENAQRDFESSRRIRKVGSQSTDIAIVASAGRFPDANKIDEFWKNIAQAKESIQSFDDESLRKTGLSDALIDNPDYVKKGIVLDDIELFDAGFFGFTPREVEVMDPQQRLLFECAVEALEQSGYGNEETREVGVFVGVGESTYLLKNLLPNQSVMDSMARAVLYGNRNDFSATRLSYKLNLTGPSINVGTACSTSLVAVHQACVSLLSYESKMALAGGASVSQLSPTGYLYQEGGVASKDGHCRAFDKDSSGTRGGSGVGVVLLKRLDDAIDDGDTIHAVIKGSAVNNDGSGKVGYTAPSVFGQASVIRDALDVASVDAASIQYIETHGTGTKLGDPIEIKALNKVFGANASGSCAITSLKPNIGHLDAAAGVAGLIKTVEALKHQQLPPSINFKQANPEIDFENSPFYVNTELKAWPRDGETPRRAGVSSFGIGGTNAHVVLEEAPLLRHEESVDDKAQLLILSAKTETALTQMQENLSRHLSANTHQALSDVSFTLQVGRSDYEYRGYAVCHSQTGAIEQLSQPQGLKRGVCESGHQPAQVWMFSGQGTQYIGMSAGLYEQEPVFKQQLDECADLLKAHIGMPQIESDIRVALFAAESEASSALLAQTRLTQPILFAVEYSLAKLLLSWGLRPEVMIGHSLGEYVAACLAGVMSLPDALKLVSARGRLMQAMAPGSMLSVGLDEAGLATYLEGTDLSIAALNGRKSSVVSGPSASIEALEITLSADDVMSKRLPTSHAFHSSMMEGMLGDFEAELSSVELRAPEQRYVSNVTGKLAGKEVTAASYWLKHVREAVRFSEGIEYIHQEEGLSAGAVWLEVGPGMVLGSLVRQHGLAGNHTLVHSMRHSQQALADREVLLGMLGECWLRGVTIDWQQVRGKVRRVPLPTYPFERERYWIDINKNNIYGQQVSHQKQGEVADWFYVPSWQEMLPLRGFEKFSSEDAKARSILLIVRNVTELTQAVVEQAARLEKECIVIHDSHHYEKASEFQYHIELSNPEHYKRLLKDIGPTSVGQILHLASVYEDIETTDAETRFNQKQRYGYYSALYLAQALSGNIEIEDVQINVITENCFSVTGEEQLNVESSTLTGLCKVLNQEIPNLKCHHIDITSHSNHQALAKQLMSEVSVKQRVPIIAFRGQKRWALNYTRFNPSLAKPAHSFKKQGHYVICGGLGNIALTLSEFLAKRFQPKLTLITRSTFPEKTEWASWLKNKAKDDPTTLKIEQLTKLEQLGIEFSIICADVSDETSMQEAFLYAERQFGEINGIVYAAGKVSGAMLPLEQTNEESCERQFKSKVNGLLILERLLECRQPDFCVVMSSLSSILGGLGFAAYASANSFVDGFVHFQHQKGNQHWLSINWDGWGFNQLSNPLFKNINQYSLTPDEGVSAFDFAMSNGVVPQLINSTGPLSERLNHWEKDHGVTEKPATLHKRPDIQTAFQCANTKTEKKLVSIWQQVLGIEQIGIQDNFFELGGDSVSLTQVHKLVKKYFESDIAIAALFQYLTIGELSGFLDKQSQVPEGESIVDKRKNRKKSSNRSRSQSFRSGREKVTS